MAYELSIEPRHEFIMRIIIDEEFLVIGLEKAPVKIPSRIERGSNLKLEINVY